MTQQKAIGRIVGLLMLVQLIAGLILPYALLSSLTAPAGAFLQTAAPLAGTVRLAILVLFVGGVASIAIAMLFWPVLIERHVWLALGLFGLAMANFCLQLIENAHWLTLLSISQTFAAADPAAIDAYKPLALAAHASFRWVHYSHILIAVAWLLTLYLTLYRCAFVPRPLAGFGMAAALLHFIGITLPAFGGYQMPAPELFGAPLGFASVVAGLWLLAKGFGSTTGSTVGGANPYTH